MNESLDLMQKNFQLQLELARLQDDNEGLKIFMKFLVSRVHMNLLTMDGFKNQLDSSILISQQTKNQINEHWTDFERKQEISKLNTEAVS